MFISIIITTYNRCEHLKIVFTSLLAQRKNQGLEYEVLVIDNNSTDRTRDAVLEGQSRFEGRLKYFLESRQGKSFAMNLGIKEAKGDILFFTDDDVILDENWLFKILECYEAYGCDAVGGRVLPVFPEGTAPWIIQNAKKLSGAVVIYENGEKTFQLKNAEDRFIGANFSVKRSVAQEVGGFCVEIGPGAAIGLGEDVDFFKKLLAGGKVVYYCYQAVVHHPFDSRRLTLKHTAKWNIQLGRYMAWASLKNGENFVFYGKIPRYLYRAVILDTCKLAFSWWDKAKFFIAWRSFFYKIGLILGYKQFYLKLRKA